jgi:nuclear pore complex protein Nup107
VLQLKGAMASDSFFASCAEVLSLCQSLKDDLSAILDPETGFASRLRDLCTEQYDFS